MCRLILQRYYFVVLFCFSVIFQTPSSFGDYSWQDYPALKTTHAFTKFADKLDGLVVIHRASDTASRTAGLTMTVAADKQVHLKSGIWVGAGSGSLTYTNMYPWNPIGVQWDLGAVSAPNGDTVKLLAEESNWSHSRLTLGTVEDSPAAYLTLSRLTPAVLFEMRTSGLGFNFPQDSLIAAVSNGKNVQLKTVHKGQTVNFKGQRTGWVMLFWSEPSLIEWPDSELKKRLTVFSGSKGREIVNTKRFRTPLLLVFSEPNVTMRSGRSLEFDLGKNDSKMAIMPLYGIEKLEADHSISKWATGLPAKVSERCDFWAQRLANYPATARESYSYDPAEDKITTCQKVEFTKLRAGGVTCVPVPPVVALAKLSGMPIVFDKERTDTNYRTAFGPYWVIDGAEQYNWTVKGVGKYVDTPPPPGLSNKQSKPVETELEAEIDKMLAENYLAPWIYETRRFGPMGNVYWRMPSETAYYLGQVMPVLDKEHQQRVREYLEQYYKQFPFLETVSLPTFKGPRRERYNPGNDQYYANKGAPDRITFAVVRGLQAYYSAVDQRPCDEVWQKVQLLMAESLRGCEWATGGWCVDKSPEPIPPSKRVITTDLELPTKITNRHLSNLIATIRLARKCGQADSPAVDMAWGRVAREFAYRLALAKYPYWLCPPGGPTPFDEPNWNAHSGANAVRTMNQFEVNCWDHTQDWRWSAYVAYLEMTPEVGRFLCDFAKEESVAFLKAVDRTWPQWWLANMTSEIGNDSSSGLVQPVNTYSLYMANAWIRRLEPHILARQADVSWTARGDLFYLHKLAETIKAYRRNAE